MATTGTSDPHRLSRLALCAVVRATGVTTLSNATVGNWLASGCPRNDDGTVDAYAVLAWLAAERRKPPAPSSTDLPPDGPNSDSLTIKDRYYLARTERARLDTERARIEFDAARKHLIDRREVVEQCREAGAMLSKQLETIGKRFGGEVAEAIHQAVDSLHRSLKIE